MQSELCGRVDFYGTNSNVGQFVIELLWGSGEPQGTGESPALPAEHVQSALSQLFQTGSMSLSQMPANADQTSILPQAYDEFVKALHQSLDLRETCVISANASRQFTATQRATIAVQRGRSLRLLAASGSDAVSERSEEMRLLQQLATAILRSGVNLHWTAGDDEESSPLRMMIADYVQSSHSRAIDAWVLVRSEPVIRDDSPETRQRTPHRDPAAIGVVIFEQFDASSVSNDCRQRQQFAATHLEQAISNSMLHSSVFLRRPLLAIGRGINWFRGRRLAIGIAVFTALCLFSVACVVLPWEYKVSCNGELMPDEHMPIYAPWDGQIVEIFVEHNAIITKGQPLLRLRNDDLQRELIAAQGKVAELQNLVRSFDSQLQVAQRSGTKADIVRLQGELAKTAIELSGAEQQAGVLQDRADSLHVNAPQSGVIATFDLRHSLQDKPVTRGDRLIQIFNPEGPWHLELRIPDYRSRYVARAMQETSDSAVVEFVLATAVEKTLQARLTSTATVVDPSEEDGLVLRSFATIPDTEAIGSRQFGSEVHAKIHCGPEPLGWCLFGDVIEFIQRHVWF